MRERVRTQLPALVVLGLILAVGLYLRIGNNDYGLPYVYYADEGSHFTKPAVAMFGGDPSPGYFQNPSAFTYLVHATLRVVRDVGSPFGGIDDVVSTYSRDPTKIYTIARTLAALLCALGVAAVYWVGARLWDRRAGLVAAALLSFAFLPVAFSRIAVTDVGTLLPVAATLLFAVRLHDTGRLAYAAAAGVAAGLAIGFKYTAGLVLLPVLAAALLPVARAGGRAAAQRAGLAALVALATALAAFFVTTPYFFIDWVDAKRQLLGQAESVGDVPKYGQRADNGFAYYLHSLTWGFGWLPLAAAGAGAVLLARRDRTRALLLLLFPLALFVYLSLQSRYFGRWLLPVYPALALLAGYAVVRGVDALRARPGVQPVVLAVATLALCWQGLVADARSQTVLGREDTRAIARRWLVANMPPSLRIIIEPVVPARFYRRPGAGGQRQFVRGFLRDVRLTHREYSTTLSPATIDSYRRTGYCTVMTTSLVHGRAVNERDPRALAYYARLARESDELFTVSPYRFDKPPQRFSYDLSYNYYSSAWLRPGPEIHIYRLRNCEQGYGGVEPGVGTPEDET